MKIVCEIHGEQPTTMVPRSDVLRTADRRVCKLCYLARLARRAG